MGKIHVVDVVNKFTEELKKEQVNYKKVWDSHLIPVSNHTINNGNSLKQNNHENSIYHYS